MLRKAEGRKAGPPTRIFASYSSFCLPDDKAVAQPISFPSFAKKLLISLCKMFPFQVKCVACHQTLRSHMELTAHFRFVLVLQKALHQQGDSTNSLYSVFLSFKWEWIFAWTLPRFTIRGGMRRSGFIDTAVDVKQADSCKFCMGCWGCACGRRGLDRMLALSMESMTNEKVHVNQRPNWSNSSVVFLSLLKIIKQYTKSNEYNKPNTPVTRLQ